VRQIAVLRRMLLLLGERLYEAGRVRRPDDVFFLNVDELEHLGAGQSDPTVRPRIDARRGEYKSNLAFNPPPIVKGRFIPQDETAAAAEANGQILEGIPVFPGVVRGRARVILRADDHQQVLPGEVLVAPFTDPAWTPYFLTASAVVMEQGGILSHGSIVAREYGLPAVTNARYATGLIQTGDIVEVDGGRGLVTILSKAAGP